MNLNDRSPVTHLQITVSVFSLNYAFRPCIRWGSRSHHEKAQFYHFYGKGDARTYARWHCRELCKIAEPIEMPFGLWMGWPNKVCIMSGAHWRNLANTTEPSTCCGDAAFLW